MKRFCLTIAILIIAGSGSARALEPANPKANATAREILNYLDGLSQRSDKRLLSGQFTNFGPSAKLAGCAEVHEKTGHWPAMIGLDYADFAKGGLECKTVTRAFSLCPHRRDEKMAGTRSADVAEVEAPATRPGRGRL